MRNAPKTAADLMAYEMNGMSAFSVNAEYLAQTSLAEAHAIATMLGAAFEESDDTAATNASVIRAAFDGIATLIALASFAQAAS